MRQNLYDTADGIAAIKRCGCATNDFNPVNGARCDERQVLCRRVTKYRVVQPETVNEMQDLGAFKAANDDGALPWRRLLQEYARFHHQGIGRQFAVLNFFARDQRQCRRDLFRNDEPAGRRDLDFIDCFIVLGNRRQRR